MTKQTFSQDGWVIRTSAKATQHLDYPPRRAPAPEPPPAGDRLDTVLCIVVGGVLGLLAVLWATAPW